MRYCHPNMSCIAPSSQLCFKTSSSDSSKLFSLQNSDHRSIHVGEESRRIFQHQQVDDCSMEGDLGKILPSCGDDAIALNPFRWHMVVDKDHCPSNSHASPLKRSTISANSAIQRKVTSHNRWSSDANEHEETESTIHLSATQAERQRNWKSLKQRLNRPTRKVSGCRASRTSEASSANVAPTDGITIPVPSVVTVPTWPPHFFQLSLHTGPGKAVRRRSFDEIPTLPQRQYSNTSLGTLDDFSSFTLSSI
jgi:hypothetical protein